MNKEIKDLMARAEKLGYRLIPGKQSTLFRFREDDGTLEIMQTIRDDEIKKLIRLLDEAAADAKKNWEPQFMYLTAALAQLFLHFSPLQDEMRILNENEETLNTFPYSRTGIEDCVKFIGDEMIIVFG